MKYYASLQEARMDCEFIASLDLVRQAGWDLGRLWYAWQIFGEPHGLAMAMVAHNIHPEVRRGRTIWITASAYKVALAQRTGELGSMTSREGEDWVEVSMERVRGGKVVASYTSRLDYAWAIRAGHIPPPGQKRLNRQGNAYQTPWDTHPKEMLLKTTRARCTDFCFGDVVGGLYTPGEMSHMEGDKFIDAQPAPMAQLPEIIDVEAPPAPALPPPAPPAADVYPGYTDEGQPLSRDAWEQSTEGATPAQLEAVASLPTRANQLAALVRAEGDLWPAGTPMLERTPLKLLAPEADHEALMAHRTYPYIHGLLTGPFAEADLTAAHASIMEWVDNPGWCNAKKMMASCANAVGYGGPSPTLADRRG